VRFFNKKHERVRHTLSLLSTSSTNSSLLDLLVDSVALEELVVLLDLEALRGVFAVLFLMALGFEERRGKRKKR